ncbi:MAG: hypothetical protein U0939_21255 [Pirellulales bacterium]
MNDDRAFRRRFATQVRRLPIHASLLPMHDEAFFFAYKFEELGSRRRTRAPEGNRWTMFVTAAGEKLSNFLGEPEAHALF